MIDSEGAATQYLRQSLIEECVFAIHLEDEMRFKRAIAVAAATIGLSVASVAAGSTAQAADWTNQCAGNAFCVWYNSNFTGSWMTYKASVSDFAGQKFVCSEQGCAGDGAAIKNNAASAANSSGARTARVYYNSNYAGPSDYFGFYTGKNLVNTYNNNASMLLTVG
ncbi:peptidase inhibitor family I36 protein [Streptomyces sp. NPDC059218]|uniref:peptidase inhibitor family I36 protein n=1 Tax=unclassified Streptomyces TaxID=2593676 RepID=UPI0036A96142